MLPKKLQTYFLLTGNWLGKQITRTAQGPNTNIAVVRLIYASEMKFISAAEINTAPTR
uniref:Uncharacterized protein n=1 Tax=Arundo donax TaxID=35708 RepID=A0A0A9AMR0_ARUDO